MRIIAVACRKGGVGKTTTTVNLAYEIFKKGHSVLVLDFDGQSDTTKFFHRSDVEFYIGDALLDRKFDLKKAIYPAIVGGVEMDGLDVIAGRSGDVMTKLDMDMISLPKREERLKRHLDSLNGKYDFVIIDTSPSTSVLGSNVFSAATEFVLPTELKEHSIDGVETILEHIQDVTFQDEEDLKFLIAAVKVKKSNTRANTQGNAYLQDRFPDNLAKTIVWERALFTESEFCHEPISIVKAGDPAAMYYKSLAKEVING